MYQGIYMRSKVSVFFTLVLFTFAQATVAETPSPKSANSPVDKRWLIKNVNVLPMSDRSYSILLNQSVLIHGNKIVKVEPAFKIKAASDIFVVDGQGKFLLPGLIDTHVHIWEEPELSAYLSYGVTTVRNASGMPFHLRFRKEIQAGLLVGPRLITTGPILNGQGPNTQPNHQLVNNAEEAQAAVKQQYEQGYRHLKVYSNLSKEAYDAILMESRRLGMTIMGHTPEGVRDKGIPYSKPFRIAFRELLDDHFVSIEHMESIVWHGLYDDLDENKARKLAKEIVAHSVAITPTLVAHHNLVRVSQTQGQYLQRPGVQTLNPFIVEWEKESYDFWSSQKPDSRKSYHEFYLNATKIFQEEGVTLITGTDSGIFTNIPGQSLIDELNLFVMAGLTPYQAIEAATINSARVLGLGEQVGQIKAGYIADLILIDADPTKTIQALESLSGLVVRGQWYSTEDISRLKQEAENTSYERSRRRVLEGLSAQGSSLD